MLCELLKTSGALHIAPPDTLLVQRLPFEHRRPQPSYSLRRPEQDTEAQFPDIREVSDRLQHLALQGCQRPCKRTILVDCL